MSTARARSRHATYNALYRPNPYVGFHPDLLPIAHQQPHMTMAQREAREGKFPHPQFGRSRKDGETPVFVALEDLTSDQIQRLKRANFTDDEWRRLDEEDRDAIEADDEESAARVEALANQFISRWKWTMENEDYFALIENEFESAIANHAGNLWEWIAGSHGGRSRGDARRRLYDGLVAYAEEHGLSDADVDTALNDYLADTNNYSFAEHTRDMGGDAMVVYQEEIRGSFYITDDDYRYELDKLAPDELERARALIESETNGDLDFTAAQIRSPKNGILEADFETGRTVYAYVDRQSLAEFVERYIDDQKEDEADDADPDDAKPYADRVVYTWPDKFVLVDLLPSELADEGKAMGMCVGRPDMGYGKAVRDGEIKILSIRRPSGKPLFTIEAVLGERGGISGIEQVKGKANRLPGFDLGKTGPEAKIKRDEVVRVFDALSRLGIDKWYHVRDLTPARSHIHSLMSYVADPWAIDVYNRFGGQEAFGFKPSSTPEELRRSNPSSRAPACGRHGEGCTGFCAPYRPRR